jgi:hypothetical protein
MRTVEAVIDKVGNVQLLEPVQLSAMHRALVTILEDETLEDDELDQVASLLPTRPFGLCAGDFVVPDDFDDPLPDTILKSFEGE